MRNVFCSFAVAAGLFCAASAHADTTYQLTLTPSGAGNGGQGSFSLPFAPSTSSNTTYDALGLSGNTLDAFSIMVGGFDFDLTSAQGNTVVQFLAGDLSSITFDGVLVGTDIQDLGISGLTYSFGDALNSNLDETGSIAASASGSGTGVTPEPSSVALLGTGLIASFGLLRRRSASL